MTLKNIKVAVNGYPEQVQLEMFRLGYSWGAGAGGQYVKPRGFEHVYGYEDGRMTHGTDASFFDDHVNEEYVLEGGELVPKMREVKTNPAMAAPYGKGINPKQGAGSMQLSPTLVSPLTVAHISLAKLNGFCKYGGANFIGTNVTMTTYLDAMQRHLDKIRMGEEFDEVDGVSHWGAIGAGIDIILCARAAGTLDDDRLRNDGQLEAYKALTPMVQSLKKLHEGKDPYHYLAANREKDSPSN